MKNKVRKRILRWSCCAGLIATVLVASTVLLLRVVFPFTEMRDVNQTTLSKIRCTEAGPAPGLIIGRRRCDIDEIVNHPELEHSDYVLTRDTGYFLFVSATHPGFWLNFSDLAFIRKFREPSSIELPTRDTWRVFSQSIKIEEMGGRIAEVLVGYLEKAPWLLGEAPATPQIDERLREEAKRIASRLRVKGHQLHLGKITSRLDAWEVVDGETGKVVAWTEDAPAKLPAGMLPSQGLGLYRQGSDLFMTRADDNDDLIAVSLRFITNVWWLSWGLVLVSFGVCALFYAACTTWFRRYFVLMGGRSVGLQEALKSGENQEVEFKRDAQDATSFLKAIAAFANTNDGTLFVGVDDEGHIVGLRAQTMKERDQFCQTISNLIRNRIRPAPAVDVHLEEVEGTVIAKICVPRGEEPLYCLGGAVYIRKGVETVQAESTEIARLVEQYAW